MLCGFGVHPLRLLPFARRAALLDASYEWTERE